MEPTYKPNDPQLVENILAEVKRSGMFDQFRKDCISDVDTKPAYQNLQFKVENTVSKFLNSQVWTPDTNRNQLRDKLRKNILDSGYLDSGIERIVDQVLYPKMAGFQSQIEELVYSYLNIERPKRKVKEEPIKEEFNTSSLLPKDLEAVSSPESEKNKSFGSTEDLDKQVEENDDDFESPAFEPLEGVVVETKVKDDDSHLSGLSNMKSEGSVTDENSQKEVASSQQFDRSMESVKHEEEESQLSQVSSGSRLSIVVQSEKDSLSPKPEVLNITEEAQMPKFSENSNSIDSRGPGKEGTIEGQSVFDFKKEEIEFQSPCRKQMTLDEKLKEEIFESENKHANIFKTDEIETNSHSSDIKLEIDEHNITESESRLKIEVDATRISDIDGVKVEREAPPKQDVSDNEAKPEEKEKLLSPSDKKDRSYHHKTSKSSKHSSKDKERDERRSLSKHSSSHHSTSKSRHSDRHHSSSSRHKSSSSSKIKDRHSSSSARDKDKSKDRHRSRSDHKTRDEKRHSDDRHTPRDKSASTQRTSELETNTVKAEENENQEFDEVFEGVVEKIDKIDAPTSTQEFIEPSPIEHYTESPCKSVNETSPSQIKSPKDGEKTPVSAPKLYKVPSSHDFMSDEDDFYGFPEHETQGTSTPLFMTPAKVTPEVIAGPSLQKSLHNRSLADEETFYGFDDATPKKPTQSMSTPKIPDLQKKDDEQTESESTGKRVRRPNTKYLSDNFTTHSDEDDHNLEGVGKSNKKRKKINLDIVRIVKKQKSEEKLGNEEKSNASTETEMPTLTPQNEKSETKTVKSPEVSPKTPEKQDNSTKNDTKTKSSKKHSKYDHSSGSRSSSRRK